MQTYFLKFKDMQEAEKVLLASGVIMQGTDEEGNTVLIPVNNNAIDDVGVISKGGEWDAEGNVVTKPIALQGYHINLRFGTAQIEYITDENDVTAEILSETLQALQQYIVTPVTPTRDFL